MGEKKAGRAAIFAQNFLLGRLVGSPPRLIGGISQGQGPRPLEAQPIRYST